MSTPHIGARQDNEGQGRVTLPFSVSSCRSILNNSLNLNELNCMGLSDCSSSVDSSSILIASAESTSNLNLKATELRLGLPAYQSPARDSELNEKPLCSLLPVGDDTSSSSHKTVVSGIKRGFPGTHSGFSEGKIYSSDVNGGLSPRPQANLNIISGQECSTVLAVNMKEASSSLASKDRAPDVSSSATQMCAANRKIELGPKAQLVGWPPIRSYRKNSIATTSKNTGEADAISRKGVLFVKVSMDGAPYLRKVDIKAYTTYQELSLALEKMFSCFSIGQSKSHLTIGEKVLGGNKLKDLVHGSEYVLAYEDKDSDWMLVGDVPWEMFIDTCRRLRIMKSSDAIGLAPRAEDKCRNIS